MKYDDTLLPFMELMRRELSANSHKGDREGWLGMTAAMAFNEITHHHDKLGEALSALDYPQISEYAADVANCCMMLLDVVGLLSASAEPSVRLVRQHKHTCANVQPGSTIADVCDCGAVVDGVAVPAERDEREVFDLEHERLWPFPSQYGPATQSDYRQRKALRLEGWQARAALERKP